MRTTFGPEGEIRGTDLLAAMVALWREGASGSLQFSRSGAMAGFELAGGEVVVASSSDSRFETAAILVRAGKLEASALERLSAQEGGDRARVALQAGLLTKREWRWGEKIRAVEVLSDLLTWLEGDYTFFRSTLREPGEFRLTIPRLVLELFLRSRDRGLVLHYLGGADVPLVRATSFESEFATFGLTSDAESVVQLIDGKSTAAEISSEAPADAFAVEKLLAALVTLGLVHPEYAAEAAEPAPRTTLPATPPEHAAAESPEDEGPEPEEEPEEEELPQEAEEPAEEEELATPPPEEEAPATREEGWPRAVPPPLDAEAEGLEPEIDLSESEPEMQERFEPDIPAGQQMRPPEEPLEPGPTELYGSSPFDRPLDTTTGIGAAERPKPRSLSPVLWLFVLLAAAVGAVLLFRARSTPPAHTAAAASASPAAATPAAAAGPGAVAVATAAPTPAATPLVPRAAVATAAPTAVPTRRAPTAVATAPRPTPARAPAKAAPPATASSTARQPWLDRAARDQKRLAADPKAGFAVQLELACEIGSLVDAWKRDRPAGSMWLLTTDYQGRTCFRVLWGRYPTREAAQRALARTPGFFSTRRNRPAVVAVR